MKVEITEVHEKELSKRELIEATLAYISLEYPDSVYGEKGLLLCWHDTHGSGIVDTVRTLTEKDKAFLLIRGHLKEVAKEFDRKAIR